MLRKIEPVLQQAGRMMLDFQHPKVFDKGRHADFVTEADLAVQAYLLEQLAKAFPDAAFFAEEKEDNVLGDGMTFIIDPIDGTTNYFRGRGCSMISIGAVEGKKPLFGAILDPYHKRLYHAEKGKGAYCNDERIHVSDTPFDHALVNMGTSPYYEDTLVYSGRVLPTLLAACTDIRRTGSACMDLCDVATGRSDAFFEWMLSPWDYCAGVTLVQEAGGRCGNLFGGDVTFEKPIPVIAGNLACYEPLQELIGKMIAPY